MLEPAFQDLIKKREKYARSVSETEAMLNKKRAAILLATEWVARNFHGRSDKPIVRVVPADWHEGYVYVQFVLKNGEAWNEILGLLELLAEHGIPPEAWRTSEDARNFARTYSGEEHADPEDTYSCTIVWQITLALREGNLGGCRRVSAGLEVPVTTAPRERFVLICDEPLSSA